MAQPIRNILIVDDSKINTFLLETILRKNQWIAKSALSVETALEIMKSEKPDLILLDLHMPGVNGFDMLDKLSADDNLNDIPVIIMSASDSDDVRKKCREKGAVDFEPKPFNIERLAGKVEKILNT